VEKGDEQLVEILANAVESKAGVRPEEDDVAEFLERLGHPPVIAPGQNRAQQRPVTPIVGQNQAVDVPLTRRGMLHLLGKAYTYKNASDAMVTVLTELAKRDPTFLERCSQHPDMHGRKRHYIARDPDALYPDRPDLRDYRESLPGDWWVATNLNNILKKTIIKTAIQVAGLRYGHDAAVEF
jgi:negative regulator of replication initiation